jgi:RNA polymerase sigma factor (sigma-70 family)
MSVGPDEVIQYLANPKSLERIDGWLRSNRVPYQDTADLRQEVVRETLDSWQSFDPGGAVGGYVHRITQRVAAQYHRKNVRRARLSHLVQQEDTEPTTPYEHLSEAQIDLLTLALLEEVPDKYQALLRARFVDGLDVKECAASFGMPVRAVQRHIEAGLKLCRRLLKSRGVEDAQRHALLPLLSQDFGGDAGADDDDPNTTDQASPPSSTARLRHGADRRLAASMVGNVAAVAVILYLLSLVRGGAAAVSHPNLLAGLEDRFALAANAAAAPATPRPENPHPLPSAPVPAATPRPPVRCPPVPMPINAEARAQQLADIHDRERAKREEWARRSASPPHEAPAPVPPPPTREPSLQFVGHPADRL